MSLSEPGPANRRRNAAFDLELIDQLRRLGEKMGEDVLGDTIAAYLRDCHRLLAAMERALTEADAKALAKAVHSFVGMSGAIGAEALVARCRALEERCLRSGFEGRGDDLAAMLAEHRRVATELTEAAAQATGLSSDASPSRKA